MPQALALAWRRLLRSPGYTLAAVITLALAIGANTAILSFADAVLFRPFPYRDPGSLYLLRGFDKKTGQRWESIRDQELQALKGPHRGFSEVGFTGGGPRITVVTADGAESVSTTSVTPNYFAILGVRPARGRLLGPGDVGQSGQPAMLTYSCWQRRFGGDDSIIGRRVTLGDTNLDVVGVLPAGFLFPSGLEGKVEVVTLAPPSWAGRGFWGLRPVVRLRPGVTRAQAQSEIDALLASVHAGEARYANATLGLEDIRSVWFPVGRPVMAFLLAASGLVLFIGCMNLAIMFLVRGQRSLKESGVRAALGATRIQIMLPIVFESCIIGLAGALVALHVTSLAFDGLLRQVPPVVYGNAPVGVDLRAALFTLALGLIGGLLVSLLPAWRASRQDAQTLIQGRRELLVRRGRLGRPLVAMQVALTVVLAFGAATVARAFIDLLNEPRGFDPKNVVTVRVRLTGARDAARLPFYVRAIEALKARPDVASVGASSQLPLGSLAPDEGLRIDGKPSRAAAIGWTLPGYFQTVGIRLLRGRLFDWNDVRGAADAAVVSEAAARALFPGRDPLGATFENSSGRRFHVVGVTGDTKNSFSRSPLAYVIPPQNAWTLSLVVKMRSRQDVSLAQIEREIRALAPGVQVTAEWWSDTLDAMTMYRNPRFQTLVLCTFTGLALGLTALGIYAIIAFSVAIRTREMGIRMTVGAKPRSLEALMVRQSLAPVVAGLLIGAPGAWWASRLAQMQLSQLRTRDPASLAAVVATVALAALVAAYVPARRASRVDPMTVLREE